MKTHDSHYLANPKHQHPTKSPERETNSRPLFLPLPPEPGTSRVTQGGCCAANIKDQRRGREGGREGGRLRSRIGTDRNRGSPGGPPVQCAKQQPTWVGPLEKINLSPFWSLFVFGPGKINLSPFWSPFWGQFFVNTCDTCPCSRFREANSSRPIRTFSLAAPSVAARTRLAPISPPSNAPPV